VQLDAGRASSHLWTLVRTGCCRSRGWPGPARAAGRSGPRSRGSRRPGAGRTGGRSPCRWQSSASARRTGRWCRAGCSRRWVVRGGPGIIGSTGAVRSSASAASHRPRRQPRRAAAPDTGRPRPGSFDEQRVRGDLEVLGSARHGCSPNACQVGARWSARSHPPGQLPPGPARRLPGLFPGSGSPPPPPGHR
jgi:hypothetical protein